MKFFCADEADELMMLTEQNKKNMEFVLKIISLLPKTC